MDPENNTEVVADDRESDIAAAFDKAEAAEAAAVEPTVTEQAPEQATGSPDEPPAVETAPTGRPRDEHGKFTKKTEEPAAAAPVTGAPAPKPVEAQQPEQPLKPPASWKPEEKDHWDKMPPQAREAVMRREVEINRALAEASTSRRAVSTLQETLAPYMPNIRAAAGGDVVGAIKTFFDYDNTLRHGTQIEKARALTKLIRGYGVDIMALDNELAGAAPEPEHTQQSAVQQAIARELGPLREMMMRQQQEQERQERLKQEQFTQTIEQFAADPKNVYFDNVVDTMADLMQLAENRGQKMTLQDAYDAACWQTPEIRSILMRNSTAQTAATGSQAAQRAKAAAVSVRSGPRSTLPSDAETANRKRVDDVAAAFDKHMSAGN